MKNIKDLKIYISVDIEGTAGICDWKETELGENDYNYFQEEMIQETIACCEALINLGITNITVRDAHDSARNIIPNRLPKEVTLIRGWTEGPCDMMAGLDNTYDGVIFIGYHSPARSIGNPLSHTLTTTLNHIKINGNIVSEFLLNTYFAQSQYNVPVILLCGDNNLTNIVHSENVFIQTVSTNVGLHGAVITKHPSIVYNDIKEKTKKAVEMLASDPSQFMVTLPNHFDTEIHFRTHKRAYRASFYPNATYLGSDKTVHHADNFLDAVKFIMFTE